MKEEEEEPIGLCVSCAVGKHEHCNAPISTVGCACPCNDE